MKNIKKWMMPILILTSFTMHASDFQTVSKGLGVITDMKTRHGLAAFVDFGDGKVYAVTTISVFLSGIDRFYLTDFSGQKITLVSAEVAADKDLVRFEIKPNSFITPFKMSTEQPAVIYSIESLFGTISEAKFSSKGLNAPGSAVLSKEGEIVGFGSVITGYDKAFDGKKGGGGNSNNIFTQQFQNSVNLIASTEDKGNILTFSNTQNSVQSSKKKKKSDKKQSKPSKKKQTKPSQKKQGKSKTPKPVKIYGELVKIDSAKWVTCNPVLLLAQVKQLRFMKNKTASLEILKSANKMNGFIPFQPGIDPAFDGWLHKHNEQFDKYSLIPNKNDKTMGAARVAHEARCTYYSGLRGMVFFTNNMMMKIDKIPWFTKFFKDLAMQLRKRNVTLKEGFQSQIKILVEQHPTVKNKL